MSAIVFATRGIPATAASKFFPFPFECSTPLEHAPSNFVPSRNHRPANIRLAPASELKAGVFEFDAESSLPREG